MPTALMEISFRLGYNPPIVNAQQLVVPQRQHHIGERRAPPRISPTQT
jgi:hypothetical protein